MSRRKLIGLITAVPETMHAKRIFEGVFGQCDKYGYNVAVFAPLKHLSSQKREYIKGELNIYELMNFDMMDGVIVDSISLVENGDDKVLKNIQQKLEKECSCPVISLNLPLGNYQMIQSRDASVFHEITEHILQEHRLTDICFLTGPKDYPISEERLNVFLDVMQKYDLEVKPENIIYGDFWYTSGTKLADRFLSGELDMPEAVICASDHMAIGLVRGLAAGGIRIPQDIIVTGFEATPEAALNDISVTSFDSNAMKTAADAVDMLRDMIEPDEKIHPLRIEGMSHMHAGMSCGCSVDTLHSARAFKESFYYSFRDHSVDQQYANVDIGQLMEGYVAEILAESETPQECLNNIYSTTYFIRPYIKYYLCLKENWLDMEDVMVSGYPERMSLMVYNTPEPNTGFYSMKESMNFETKMMLPQMFDNEDEPSVFYFSPVHFKDKMLGYSVLQRALKEKKKINLVYRTWLRNINNSLEMIRAKNRLMMLSICDEMTGAYNRRGMGMMLEKCLEHAQKGDYLFVAVIDMDGLKYINDTFGHSEGDFGIKTIYKAASSICLPGEICVRAGGDEFYVFGVGKYNEKDLDKRIQDFCMQLGEYNSISGKPYEVEASIGVAFSTIDENLQINNVINIADERMYKSKVVRKKQRV